MSSKVSILLGVVLTFFATLILVCTGLYLWKGKALFITQECITEDITTDELEIDISENIAKEMEYIVVFSPGGLFTDIQRDLLMEKLVYPYYDYYSDKEDSVISMIISVVDSEDEFYVDAIHNPTEELDTYIHSSFLFGSRSSSYSYWIPDCFESICEFTESFESNHPEVITEYCNLNGCE